MDASSDRTQADSVTQEVIKLAETLLRDSISQQTPAEKHQAEKLARMMQDPLGKAMIIALSDQAFRSKRPARVADQISYLIERYGIPDYFDWWEKIGLGLAGPMGKLLPALLVPIIIQRIRQESRNVILPSEASQFNAYLEQRRSAGIRLNVNKLGEAILGEEEAGRRLAEYIRLLEQPNIDYISVKISSIFSQINLVAYDQTVSAIQERLRTLYRSAMQHPVPTGDGQTRAKFVNLDLEEYRDLHLTVDAFTGVLDEDEFLNYRAGIVLQAYLPDSFAIQRQLTAWAQDRMTRGGASIKLRIVKGANLAMEQVDAAWHGWEQAPYGSKAEVDANYKRMVTFGCDPEHARAVNLGIATHNLFDMAYGLYLREQNAIQDYVEMEMLEGMANHQARAVLARAGGLLLYAPVVSRDDFQSAVAYLVRRLDENTAPENFLHDLFDLQPHSPSWEAQKQRFVEAVQQQDSVAVGPRRQQNRSDETRSMNAADGFENEPDTDFALAQNRAWLDNIRSTWQAAEPEDIPLQIGGEFQQSERQAEGIDPSKPDKVAYRYALADREQVNAALDIAVQAKSDWQARSIAERKTLLIQCAATLAQGRGDLIGAMLLDGGKRPFEADVEISEAVDFANYYARSLDEFDEVLQQAEMTPFGLVVVTPPWNFPLAIPCGGVLAALMAGNVVILKPAPETVLTAWHMVNLLWDAGIPKNCLQFLPTSDDEIGQSLLVDQRTDAVILTGAYATAQLFKSWKPDLRLFAETSGKNAIIVTALADHDQAVSDLVTSAFGHAGQKCSAASLAILEAEVYDSAAFRRQIKDAASSLRVASAWEPDSIVTPLIREPGTELHRALTSLDPGEEWLLEPQQIGPQLWSPGIKLGVQPDSFFFNTECFGPVLGLVRARDLDHAITMANSLDYGLTGGIHSLDEREVETWKSRIEVGNAYINKKITGAIVQRQPFGGWKKSALGYAKAGGPNYVASLGHWRDKNDVVNGSRLDHAKSSFQQAWQSHFSQEHTPGSVLGEDNIFRYVPIGQLLLRIEAEDSPEDLEIVLLAARTCGVSLSISCAEELSAAFLSDAPQIKVYRETVADFVQRLEHSSAERLRVLSPPSEQVYRAANANDIFVIDVPVTSQGRLELRHYLREQAISHAIHRYGNILPRVGHQS